MNSLLIRVGADQSVGGGSWNGPVDLQSGKFVYVPIPETQPVHVGMEKNYSALSQALSSFGASLPPHLRTLSTPERSCIGSPERRCINDDGKKAPNWGPFRQASGLGGIIRQCIRVDTA